MKENPLSVQRVVARDIPITREPRRLELRDGGGQAHGPEPGFDAIVVRVCVGRRRRIRDRLAKVGGVYFLGAMEGWSSH